MRLRRRSFLMLGIVLMALVGVVAASRLSIHRRAVDDRAARPDSTPSNSSAMETPQRPAIAPEAIGPIDPHVIAGGGGTSTGGTFSESGTIGEVSASNTQTGGTFTLNGGFWNTLLTTTTATPTPTPSPTPTPTPSPSPTPTPPPNVVQFSSSTYSVVEDCTTVTITVNRVGDTSGAASVDYHTSDVTATERRDYITALGKLSFAAGETSKSFVVLINDDSIVEGNETFNVNLGNPAGMTLGAPAIATVTIVDNPTEPSTNMIDDSRNYVCQHYHDFLNRQPDPSGWDFWTNQTTNCGSSDLLVCRINVSASFFLSIEFQQTGYLVERTYKVSYGDADESSTFPSSHHLSVPIVRLNEFLGDTGLIGKGVIVGQGNWQQQLEDNKVAFMLAFVQRSRFTTAFPTTLTPAQFVDQLFANAGVTPSTADRDAAINEFGSANNTTDVAARGRALRRVAENSTLTSNEFNRAFVLMQYFGYLRRNPNDPQDSDYTGYDFWLTKLNQFNGNYINAEMVKAFITSIEYRQRFGP